MDLGRHLLVDLHGCRAETLDDLGLVRDTALSVADILEAQVLGTPEHVFQPQGITVIVAIAESHVSIHTWPEHGYAAVDVVTCGDGMTKHTIDRVVETVARKLEARQTTALEVRRGTATGSLDPVRVPVTETARLDHAA